MQAESLPNSVKAWVSISLAACVFLVVFTLLEIYPLVVVSKLMASTAFVLVAASVGALRNHAGRWMFAALALSWLGDMLLLDKLSGLFLAGLASFLLAHIAYVIAFIKKGVSRRWMLMIAFPVVVISLGVSMWLAPHLAPDMVMPVRVYTAVITAMVIAAVGTWGAGASVLIPIGALLFYFSDLSVAAGQFVQTEFPNYVWGLPFYYVGQILLALSAGPSLTTQSVN